MNEVSRRTALKAVSGSTLGALGFAFNASAGEEVGVGKGEWFLIGAYPLGDHYDKKKRRYFKSSILEWVPDHADIVKSFNQCTLHIFDRRIEKAPKEWIFGEKFEAKVLITGKLIHTFEKDKKTYTIRMNEVEAINDSTDNRKTPPFRRIGVRFTMEMVGVSFIGTTTSHLGYGWEDIEYDITGKRLDAMISDF